MRYALVFHAPEPDGNGLQPTDDQIAEMQQLMTDYVSALHAAGVFVSAEMLQPSAAATTVSRRSGGTVIEDGPFAEAKEALAGVFILDVPGPDAALAWAEKFPGATYGVVEVRPVGVYVSDGSWMTA